MTYVIAEPCIGTKDLSCVEVCPVDCIHPTQDEPGFDDQPQLYIDPEECIDCDACVEACPVDACFAADPLPDEWQDHMQTHAGHYKGAAPRHPRGAGFGGDRTPRQAPAPRRRTDPGRRNRGSARDRLPGRL